MGKRTASMWWHKYNSTWWREYSCQLASHWQDQAEPAVKLVATFYFKDCMHINLQFSHDFRFCSTVTLGRWGKCWDLPGCPKQLVFQVSNRPGGTYPPHTHHLYWVTHLPLEVHQSWKRAQTNEASCTTLIVEFVRDNFGVNVWR